jgi:hypothetical protein
LVVGIDQLNPNLVLPDRQTGDVTILLADLASASTLPANLDSYGVG